MNAADFQPKDRLTVAKLVLEQFIRYRRNDRIGLVVFSGVAYTQAPLTLDHRLLIEVLKTLKTGVLEDGTAIGNGLGIALSRLRESEAKSRIVVLITDGYNNKGNISPMEAAKLAKKMGVKVFTVQVGKGGVVPYPMPSDESTYSAAKDSTKRITITTAAFPTVLVREKSLEKVSATRPAAEAQRQISQTFTRTRLNKGVLGRSVGIDTVSLSSIGGPFLYCSNTPSLSRI